MTVTTMPDRQQLLVHGTTFAAVDAAGDITGRRGAAPDGLFVRDARHLSRWLLTVDGVAPEVLLPTSGDSTLRCVLTPPSARAEPPAYTVFREQAVSEGGFVETLRLSGSHPGPVTVHIALTVDADFADQFELRSDHRTYTKAGSVRSRHVRDDGVEFRYRRGDWRSGTTVTAEPAPDTVTETGASARRLNWALMLEPQGSAELTLRVAARPHGDDGSAADTVLPLPAMLSHQRAEHADEFAAGIELPTSSWPELAAACERGLADLAALQVPATGPGGEDLRVPAAGVPWFQALLARDALITSLFLLPYRQRPAHDTLLALAASQAQATRKEAVSQPGKIVHELRHGELAHFDQVPYRKYYGSVDATPLFLITLGAYTDHTGDGTLARRLERHARAAVTWMLDYGGLTSRGYLVYRADRGGLANQNWKDSPGAICFADGTRTNGPVMAAGAQGYAYDALRRTAHLARTIWADPTYAGLLEQAAADLRDRFQHDFWMPDRSFPALALDEDGQVDALASDAGHLLWSGLLDKEYGEAVGRRLVEPDFFSGWGVRTVAAGQGAYHPLSYHRGSVWPHDNALIALGLARYGLHDEARVVARGLVDAAVAGGDRHRLPEVLSGYGRTEYPAPVPYPHACARESRSAAAPLGLLTAVGGAGV